MLRLIWHDLGAVDAEASELLAIAALLLRVGLAVEGRKYAVGLSPGLASAGLHLLLTAVLNCLFRDLQASLAQQLDRTS